MRERQDCLLSSREPQPLCGGSACRRGRREERRAIMVGTEITVYSAAPLQALMWLKSEINCSVTINAV